MLINTIKEIVISTPIWVWMLLLILIRMGIKGSQEKPVNLSKMLIAPLIFMGWGLCTISTFSYLGINLISYIIALIPGALFGYGLNSKYQHFQRNDMIVYKMKSYLPLVIVLINFVVKYLLNVMLVLSPDSLLYDSLYSTISGLSVGLFLGGIYYTYKMTSKLNSTSKI